MTLKENPIQVAAPAARFGARHFQTILMATASFTIYTLRVNLSVAIVGMAGLDKRGNNDTIGNTTSSEQGVQVYDWDEATQGLVLSSFFWGYLVTQVPAGVLTQRLGGHKFMCWAIFSTSVLSLLLPPCAYIGGWVLVCINRMLQGITQGFVYPSIFTMMGLWAPVQERSTLSGIILGAQTMGPVVATPLAGLLVDWCGWPSCFYFFGVFGVLFSFVAFKFGADSPMAHKTISAEERAYIVGSLGGASEKMSTPWRGMLSSGPAWAAITTMALQGGVFLAFLTKIPTYLSTVLKFEIKQNGLLTALPYFVSWSLSFVFSMSCDWLVKRGYLSLTWARKIYNSISHGGAGLAILGLGFCTDKTLSVVLLTLSIGVMSASYPGVQSNFMDLSPNFSGTIFSISNFLSAIAGVIGPILIGIIVTESGSVAQWRIVYCMLSGVMVLSGLHFVLFGSADVQPWNNPKRREQNPEDFPDTGKKLASVS